MIENPVFIVGTERSGSNLLRLILNELPDLTIPHPPHLMRDLTPLLPYFGDLQQPANFRRLAEHAVRLVELHFAPWPLTIDLDRLVFEAAKPDLYSLYAGIYDQYRLKVNKARWGCKSTFMIHHVREILAHHKQPQFIHLVRDVRDVAVSARDSVFCHYHPYYVAKLWQSEQQQALHWRTELPPQAWHTLRYEDLIQDPEGQIREVCRFLGAPYQAELLDFFKKPAAQELSNLSRSWENVGRPVLRQNSQKFLQHLRTSEIRLIETIAHAEMQAYGYSLLNPTQDLQSHFGLLQRTGFFLQEEWLMLKQEGQALFADRNARFRLRKKAHLLGLRLSRPTV